MILEVARVSTNRPKLPRLSETRRNIKDLTKQSGSIGNKLVKTGGALIAFPEPITGVVGVPILITGAAIRRKSSANLKEVHDKVKETLTSLASESFYF